ncbi:hypothetical protein E3O19_00720 [Cryobacterium algoritolerans]|uniref:Uncharacterized protein n=1 Tax=Cryobacterium algoritolerans TaxID=1259184 RepID=A0A4R8WXF1_9MICO|nr:hypothetical protein [Cryobacterium algoritolerans]TFC20995.1 hypothetical protein E3O19_00720 [Cryobacterium algoritolerans]
MVATSTKADVFRVTVKKRSELGHVFVFDFDGITRWPDKARWDMVDGCQNPDAAQSRAAAIVNARPAGSTGMKDSAHFVEGVKIILRSLLHAAALIPGGNMRDVVRWAQDFTDHEPSAILRDLSPNGAIWARELDQWCREDAPETIGNTKTTLSRITASLTDARVLDLLCPADVTDGALPVAPFRARDFVLSTDTVYCLVGTHQVTQTSKSLQRNGAGQGTTSTSTSEREERRMKVEDIRKIPEGHALLLYREKEAIVQLTPWWKRPDADQLHQSHQSQAWSLKLEGITA